MFIGVGSQFFLIRQVKMPRLYFLTFRSRESLVFLRAQNKSSDFEQQPPFSNLQIKHYTSWNGG